MELAPERKASVLIEALGYLRRFRHRFIVVKLGGSLVDNPQSLSQLLEDVIFLATAGVWPVVVHGGGKSIDRTSAAAGIVTKKVQGRRYTDPATMEIVARVLRNETNSWMVNEAKRLGGRAVGLHSAALQSLYGERLVLKEKGQIIDLGLVGQVTRVDVDLIRDFTAAGVIPVIPSLAYETATHDHSNPESGWLNINADTAAAAVAAQLEAEKLVLVTDTPGVLIDRKDTSTLQPSLSCERCRDLIATGIIEEGMIPKVEACLEALAAGVGKTHMIDGRLPHALLLEIFTRTGIGTEIVTEGESAAVPATSRVLKALPGKDLFGIKTV
jgi:acetylglutamate kinase